MRFGIIMFFLSYSVLSCDLRITKHISFFYNINRFKYLNQVVENTNLYKCKTDIYIHTNLDFDRNNLVNYHNGLLNIIVHNITGENPFKFPYKTRKLMAEQQDNYDIFIYTEDDIKIPQSAIEYWFEYNDLFKENNYNVGFIRIEIDKNGYEYMTDIVNVNFEKINETLVKNKGSTYCAFWIYDKDQFKKFVNSKYYDPSNIINYDFREKIAIGLHSIYSNYFTATVIPIHSNKLDPRCKVFHLPNNYIGHAFFAKHKFEINKES